MRFTIIDTKRYPLKIDNEDENLAFYRYEHRATLGWGVREYMVFVDHVGKRVGLGFTGPTSHIEEITGGHLERIEDDSLAQALQDFAMEKGFLNIGPPIIRRLA
jgi:hypothetical protein